MAFSLDFGPPPAKQKISRRPNSGRRNENQPSTGPRAVSCYICGRQYMLHSFAIHETQCRELYEKREELKPPKERRRCPDNPFNGMSMKGITSQRGLMDAMNTAAAEAFTTGVMSSCRYCGRTFLPEKLLIHNRSCTADNPARRVTDSVGRTPAAMMAHEESAAINVTTKSFPGSKGGGGYNNTANPPWMGADDDYDESMGGGGGGGATVRCADCGRSFNAVAYSKHQKICKKVFTKKRRVFDSAKQRAVGTDLMPYFNDNKRSSGGAGAKVSRNTVPSATSRGASSYNGSSSSGGGRIGNGNSATVGYGGGGGGGPGGYGGMPKWKYDSLSFRAAMRAAKVATMEEQGGRGRLDHRPVLHTLY